MSGIYSSLEEAFEFCWSSFTDEHSTLPNILCNHWFTSSVWNFCRWVADVPPRETSLSGDERGETSAVRRLEETYPHSINSLSMLHAKSFSSSIFANPILFSRTKLATVTLKRHTLFLIPCWPDSYLWPPTTPLRGSFSRWTHCEVDNSPVWSSLWPLN